ncbi:MAG: CbiQ family ECF transporter T component [Sideroxydans sp.]|nr:CbiQ family ECF transporter T component [Sideroxydans sp.]
MKLVPHPAVQILVWMLLALLVQRLQALALLALCAVLFGIALKLCAKQLLSLLRRTRWIFFSLLLIYAYTTPGTALWPQLGIASPTHEGLLDGLLQLGRLISVLSGLAILLELLPQTQLISGLYSLAYPLRWLGLSRERIAVRLALTLEYAESAMRDTAGDWKATIANAMQPSTNGATHIELRLQAFGLVDVLMLVASAAVLMGVWR